MKKREGVTTNKATFSYKYSNRCVDEYGRPIPTEEISNNYNKVRNCYVDGAINTYHGYVTFPSTEFEITRDLDKSAPSPTPTVTFHNILYKYPHKPPTAEIPDSSFSGYIVVIEKNNCFYMS